MRPATSSADDAHLHAGRSSGDRQFECEFAAAAARVRRWRPRNASRRRRAASLPHAVLPGRNVHRQRHRAPVCRSRPFRRQLLHTQTAHHAKRLLGERRQRICAPRLRRPRLSHHSHVLCLPTPTIAVRPDGRVRQRWRSHGSDSQAPTTRRQGFCRPSSTPPSGRTTRHRHLASVGSSPRELYSSITRTSIAIARPTINTIARRLHLPNGDIFSIKGFFSVAPLLSSEKSRHRRRPSIEV